jgi:pimeloyl-ACP methyl ester carboxylesterase
VALGVLNLDPRLFDAAVLIGVHPGLDHAGERAQRREDDAVLVHALHNDRLDAFVDGWEEMPLFTSQRGLPDALLAKQREARLAHDAEGLARALEVLGLAEMPSYGPGMASLDVPIIVMAGSLDEKFSGLAQLLAAQHQNVEAEVVSGVGHNLLLEAPKAVAQTLKRAQERAQR